MNETQAGDSSSPFTSGAKKIHRTTFKQDTPVKSYKCDFVGSDITTAAKLYVSNKALYIVHRPKRKKMTTIPFTEVSDIVPYNNNQCLDVRLTMGPVYTFSNFQRPGHAVGFLVNFWCMVRKQKLLPKQSSVDGISRSSSDSCSMKSQIYKSDITTGSAMKPPIVRSRLHHGKTERVQFSSASWCSQNSFSATDSDTDSRPTDSLKSSFNGSSNNPSLDSKSVFFGVRNNLSAGRDARGSAHSLPNNLPSTPTTNSPPILRIPHSDQSVAVNTVHQSSKKTDNPDEKVPKAATTQPVLLSTNNGQLPKSRSQSATRSRLSESPYRSIWPLNYLPHPLTSPPRRCTMLIAYAILGFLMLSTMHLYHRLAVFELFGQPALKNVQKSRPYSNNHQPISNNLNSLEAYLTQLADLTAHLSEAMLKMSAEVHAIVSESSKFSDADKSTPLTPNA